MEGWGEGRLGFSHQPGGVGTQEAHGLQIGRALGTTSDLQPGGRGRGQLLREVG